MKKEVSLAIVAGIIAGLVLAFGVWRLTSTLKKSSNTPQDTTSQQTSSPTPVTDFSVVVSKPSNMSVITSDKTTIVGLTKPNSTVILSTDQKDYQTAADQSGSFEKDIELLGGLNTINISSFDEQGASSMTFLNIVYSSEFEKYLTDEKVSDDDKSTDSAETIREKVQQKLSETLNQPIFYMGTITDIAEGTIQLKSDDNGIQQISITEETSFVSEEDLAIGDFIVAMGFKNGNDVLDTKRILTTDPTEENKISAYWATISEIEGKKVTYKDTEGQNILIDFPKTWIGPDISDLEVGQIYIVTGNLEENIISLRTIFELDKNLTE